MAAHGQARGWSSSTFGRRLIGCLVAFDLMLIAASVWTLRESRAQFVDRAEATTNNLAQILERDLLTTVNAIDLVLLSVKDEIERKDIPESPARIESYIRAQVARVSMLRAIRTANAEGVIERGLGSFPASMITIADRDHFQYLREHPEAGLYISRPGMGHIVKGWTLHFSRRLNHRDGSFAGVVFGTTTLEQLARTLSLVDVGTHGSISLRGGDLSLLARFPRLPDQDRYIGDRMVEGDYLGAIRSNRPVSHFTAQSRIDGSARTYTLRSMASPPFYILVGLAQADYLRAWRGEALRTGFTVSGLVLFSVLIGWVAGSAWRRHMANQAERERLIEELTQALAEVKNLSGLLPICGHCKKIRDDGGYWNQLETFISRHTEATFTHGICPDCAAAFREEAQAIQQSVR